MHAILHAKNIFTVVILDFVVYFVFGSDEMMMMMILEKGPKRILLIWAHLISVVSCFYSSLA
jgi:hypothetical protein